MPILVSTVIAYSVAGLFTISLYDMLMEINDLPYLPRVKPAEVYRLRARDTMHTDFPFLSLRSTGADALALISSKRSAAEDASTIAQFPLVDCPERMVLLGAVSRDDLEAFVLKRSSSSGMIRVHSTMSDGSDAAIYRSTSRILTETRSNWLNELLPFDLTPSPPETTKKKSLNKIAVDLAPFQVSDLTPTAMLHYLFAICTYGRMYVTYQGTLVGVLFKGDFLKKNTK